jgi:hypothetical protein
MALSKTVTTEVGITVENAYIRVSNVRLHGKQALVFDVCIHADANSPAIEKRRGSSAYSMDGSNPFIQAYEHLKTRPDYSDAGDV